MATPATIARVTPTGFKLADGYQTLIACAGDPDIQFWEETVKPPGIEGGELIDTTTMHNATYRTKDTKHLKSIGNVTGTAMYDPDVWPDILAQVNRNQAWTVHFPTGDTIDFYGALLKFDISDHKEGEKPQGSYDIGITNWDPVNYVEQGPVYTPAAGT